MLDAIGVGSLDELFALIPAELRLKRPLDIPPALTEMELTAHMDELAGEERRGRAEGLLPRRRQLRPFHSGGGRLRSPRAASSTPRTRPISPKPARATCKSSSSIRR